MSYDLEKVTIYKYQYDDMKRKLEKLKTLEQGGVENWEYYDYVLRFWRYDEDHRNALSDTIEEINDVLTEADVDQPAGSGCGYSITFDEDMMADRLKDYVKRYLEIERTKPLE